MSEGRTIIKALKESGSSKLIRRLVADQMVPSVTAATSAVELDDEREALELHKKVFYTPRIVSLGSHFAYTLPEKRELYRPLVTSNGALSDLDLKVDEDFYKIFDGEKLVYNKVMFPYSLAYAGFQFGNFAGQLGDGRVTNLFELRDKNDKLQIFQLKGSGMTPFSRFADGKAVLRSSIREFIISESLHNIGIPSTRVLQLTSLPKTKAQRTQLEQCAVVCRFSPCWIRFGNFDLFGWKPNLKGLVELSDYCINNIFEEGRKFPSQLDINIFKKDYFPDTDGTVTNITSHPDEIKPLEGVTRYDLFYRYVANINAECVAYWQVYGFLNDVLNTDNTSIMGLSIDFGPFSFLEKFQPDFTPNHDDISKRYSFENQPTVIWWNLAQFAQSLAVLIGAGENNIDFVLEMKMENMDEKMEHELVDRANTIIPLTQHEYKFRFTVKYADIMSKRLGLNLEIPTEFKSIEDVERAAEVTNEICDSIIEPLLDILQKTQIDYNNFFVNLQNYSGSYLDSSSSSIDGLDKQYLRKFLRESQIEKLKNYLEIEKLVSGNSKTHLLGDSGATRILVKTLEQLKAWIKTYITLITNDTERKKIAKEVNPLFTPRNWILEQVIDDITHNQKTQLNDTESDLDTSLLQKLYLISSNPYNSSKWDNILRPEKENEWFSLKHGTLEDQKKFMKQGICSS